MVRNTYEDADYAAAYAALDWSGTYDLVRRELPEIPRRHTTGDRALDFGCESWPWVSETTVPPWVIYVLKNAG